ncbi:hypothetical protein CcCBS67573_g03707 [Chytriomyces confervae]|uniref:N-acetyltransferase domain-containing protein n=1 Tax=Chytriomyces confervae TaxID=246404 RepID=A0A507FIA3_9FUNG|nr:hypothetical protein HDU80_001997 [Chytriomyces hyalinus]TPX75046.1 hypothetical protein CcCBS67573_g03707 [Chytriomyces confervae]
MAPAITLTPAQPSEQNLSAIVQLRKECGWGADDVPDWFAQMQAGKRVNYIVTDNTKPNDIVGMVCLVLDDSQDPDLASPAESKGCISKLFVRTQYQGMGYGRAIMDAIEDIARTEYALRTVSLTATNSENDVALAMYRRRGYKEFRPPREVFWHSGGEASLIKSLEV